MFFVTSSDSGSLVIDAITAGGKMDAPVSQRIFWCIFEGLIAIALLLGCVALVIGPWQGRWGHHRTRAQASSTGTV